MTVSELYDTLPYGPAPEDSKLAQAWLDDRGRKFGVYIDGAWHGVDDQFEVFSPGTGNAIATVAQAEDGLVDRAVRAARRAQPSWGALPGVERGRYLYAIARHVQKHSRLFAVLESLNNGKPIRETRDLDIPLVSRHFYYHAGVCDMLPDHEPVGVCGQIIPWNFPLLMLAWKIAPAIALGNTVVLKPAEFTPLTALLFAEICAEVGLPPGVVNIITGDGRTGQAIVEHSDIDKIAFTGSTEVGRIIRRATAGTGKKLSLELGGKSPFIIFDDADLDGAVEGLVDAIWFNQGQVCCAGSRLLVQESVADVVLNKVRRRMQTLRVGDPLDKAVDIGAIVAPVQRDRIHELVTVGVNEGAELFQAGTCPAEGWFYPPTLLTNVSPASTVAQEEIFGPVLVAMPFRTPAEAVDLANNTVYGLAASVWSENLNLAFDIASRVKAGTVWINCTNQFDASSGFGGFRESGFGREGGIEGLYEYVKPRHQDQRRPELASDPVVNSDAIDRTHKLYIGGKQVRPDSGHSLVIHGHEIARGNRKDIRNAVEAARSAQPGWQRSTAYLRSQVLYYLAENLQHADLFGASREEIAAATDAVFRIAGQVDKFEGRVHAVPSRGMAYTQNEPIGVVGAVLPDNSPLLSLVTLIAAGIGMGNAVVLIASETNPLPSVALYRVLEASDIPAGVVNIVTGLREELVPTLADHDGIDAIFAFGGEELRQDVELRSAANLKQTWVSSDIDASVDELLRRCTQVKNVWVPYGE
ncbi:MAG: aldehyde dehydrogenase family protein [Methanoregulaceae archaeon]|nr:aldehyde dehydrogenase family protein [Methanoregulaceae archaeon]